MQSILLHYFKKQGLILIGKHKISENIVGDKKLHVVVVMEFPSSQAIKKVFESEAYKALLPYRDKAFTDLEMFL